MRFFLNTNRFLFFTVRLRYAIALDRFFASQIDVFVKRELVNCHPYQSVMHSSPKRVGANEFYVLYMRPADAYACMRAHMRT